MTLFKVSSGLVQLSNMTELIGATIIKIYTLLTQYQTQTKKFSPGNDSVSETLPFSGVTEDKAINIMLNSVLAGEKAVNKCLTTVSPPV
jgi:hypothetical protein